MKFNRLTGSLNEQEIMLMKQNLWNKVDKEDGKGLSTLDFTQALKNKLDSLNNYPVIEIDDTDDITGYVIDEGLEHYYMLWLGANTAYQYQDTTQQTYTVALTNGSLYKIDGEVHTISFVVKVLFTHFDLMVDGLPDISVSDNGATLQAQNERWIKVPEYKYTVTLSSANWSNNSITVNATGVTTSNMVIVSPIPANIADWSTDKIYCSAQGSGTLTFSCTTTPTSDIVVNIFVKG